MTLGALVDDLEHLAQRLTRDDSFHAVDVGFGARDLRVHARAIDRIPLEGLFPPSGSAPAARLYLVDAEDVRGIRIPETSRLAAYGAVQESIASAWRVLHDIPTGRLLALHVEERVAVFHPGTLFPPRERAEFCRPLLHWLAILDGNVVVHAGAVARGGRAVLVAGTGNAGKSTLARVCLSAGFEVLGDNVVEVDGDARIHPSYPTMKIRPNPVVPVPASWPEPVWDGEPQKHIYFLGGGIVASAAAHAATLVLGAEGPDRPRPLPVGTAVFRVAPNTVAQFPFYEAEALRRSGEIVAARPTFEAGRLPIPEIPELVAGLLDSAAA